ncbi:MAG: hypothetical protein KDC95_13365 [Planctomycetes bacterium]|nr:hypothetical protein [Planctomycetota bacterium]
MRLPSISRGRNTIGLVPSVLCAVFVAGAARHVPALPQRQSAKIFAKELDSLLKELDRGSPFFVVKGIAKDWKKAKAELRSRVKKCKSEADFFDLVVEAGRRLRDGHFQITKADVEKNEFPKSWWPGIAMLPATENRVVVMGVPRSLSGVLEVGDVVTKIDGKPARDVLDARAAGEWDRGGYFSSPQRARFFAYRTALMTEEANAKFDLEWIDSKGKKRRRSVRAEYEPRGWQHEYNMPEGLESAAKSVYFAKIGTTGYIYFRRLDATAESGFAKAVAGLADVSAWIVDLRGNTGGGYDRTFVDRLPELAKDSRKVAVLIDGGCISAGETMARDLVRHAKARLYGQTTAGSSSTKKLLDLLGGKIQVRYSNASRNGIKRDIEFYGIEPDVIVEADPDEVRSGKNSMIEYALRQLADSGK